MNYSRFEVSRNIQMPEKVKSINKKVNLLEIKFERLIEALERVDGSDPRKLAEGQRKLGDCIRWNPSAAHFAGWLVCPVCKKETLHYTKDTHDNPISKMRRIWCEDCRVVQMQFKQTNEKWEKARESNPAIILLGASYLGGFVFAVR